jgi:hypothetical protein
MANKTKRQAGTAGAGTQAGTGPTNLEMVRRAQAELGKGAMPLQIRAFVKDRFGQELNTNLISYYKKRLAGKGKKKRPGKKAGGQPKQQPPAEPTGQTKAPARAATGISLDDVRLVKGLVGRLGPEPLRGLIDLLSR